MKDRRLTILANTIEARFPGVRVIVESYECEEDPTVRWRVVMLHCRRKELCGVAEFAIGLGTELFHPDLPFITDACEAWATAAYLAEKRRAASAPRKLRPARRRTA